MIKRIQGRFRCLHRAIVIGGGDGS